MKIYWVKKECIIFDLKLVSNFQYQDLHDVEEHPQLKINTQHSIFIHLKVKSYFSHPIQKSTKGLILIYDVYKQLDYYK